jgi:hypothetical protein
VPVGHQLSILRQSFQRCPFPLHIVALNVVGHARLKNEKRAVDPPRPGLRLLRELRHLVVLQLNVTKTVGFGFTWVSSAKREPTPPARIPTFITRHLPLSL